MRFFDQIIAWSRKAKARAADAKWNTLVTCCIKRMSVCVCACVCVREREKERDKRVPSTTIIACGMVERKYRNNPRNSLT